MIGNIKYGWGRSKDIAEKEETIKRITGREWSQFGTWRTC